MIFHRYLYVVAASGLPVLAFAGINQVPVASTLQARDAKPGFPYDENTTSYCSFWYDNDGSMSFQDVISVFGVPLDKFLRWNPSVTTSGGNFLASRSYCVEASGEPTSAITGTPTSTSTHLITTHSTTESVSTIVTTTTPSNGIKTPLPTQPEIVGNCNKFYFVNQGENCDTIASKNGVPLNDFLTWNPKAGQKCTGLWADTYACVSVIGYKPPATSTMPSNGVQTPVPTQPGMVSNCNKFVFVKTDDSCASIASKAAISTSDFLKWNPQVGGQCKGLWANAYACVGVLSAFRLKTRYHADCTGDVHNDVSVSGAGICINTDCKVASLEVATEGYCPDGQVQISYWEQPGCTVPDYRLVPNLTVSRSWRSTPQSAGTTKSSMVILPDLEAK
ncbi:hypothetical protein Purlil1_14084 [Purpureocillium lilacinum]|uniref:LysM domain-containing protein n=1 Tax=Purpureocillium lilacinum TaxID=33203 RepID=A0ABR0BCD0_PURLI|nr:hypothetical protein Purlil1_14084 [Purpureocillium lilacinum]